ncbi:amino acid adenylation domain-containing protein [Streptomyces sp. Isolate_45]|uniref:amino acid adenylation domain-containing protein n=1 Tax=Streptomyces sp. Isolate_45 TaxID=2950111 RepID=UPI002481D580|nr:amino acid adenylation domain-containing protein [Streptomyces sp. Isolate_45]MDA5285551.1 amino acid adenylation domain-containing protein [Streptomyces sp. Isolate_45]
MAEPPLDPSLVHHAVARHARATPEAVALVHRDTRVDYATLDAAAGRYAAELAEHGVGPGSVVPLLLPRSPRLVAAQLAVLRLGAAYTSLDGRWPTARLRQVAATLGDPTTLVAEGAVPLDHPHVVWTPGEDLHRTARQGTPGAPARRPSPADPAAVIFTSGTTGRPKGVVLPHRAITRIFRDGGPPGFGRGNVMPQAAPPWWDMYAYELFGQLMTGGTSVLTDGDHLLPQTLRRMIAGQGATTLRLTTTLFHLFVDEDPDCFTGLRHVYAGGERMSPAHAAAFLSRHPGTALFNGYGPAESCMHATSRAVRPEDCDRADGIPLGTPVPHTEVIVLDPHGRPCPPGLTGEIHVAGEGLALGYLDEPEATASAFVPVELPGATVRAYRTGDFGHLDGTGTLHFRGRTDRQLKIRGHRVEAAEIETTAASVAGVRSAVAVPLRAADGTPTGIALFYTCADDGSHRPAGEPGEGHDPLHLHEHLTAVLPDYLVPAVTSALEALPLTPNGKLDRAALESTASRRRRRRPARRPAHRAPVPPIERSTS